VLHAQAELDAVPQGSKQVEWVHPDPAPELAASHPFKHDVRPALDLLDGKRLYDVRVLSQLDPESALRSEPRTPGAVRKELIMKCLECNGFMARGPEAVSDQVNDAHAPVMDLEDFEPIDNSVPDLPESRHDGSPPLALGPGFSHGGNSAVVEKPDRPDG
jgi:hypothetical protein